MPNNIALAKKYVDLLDEVYKVSSLTSVLDSDMSLSRAGANTNEIVIPKLKEKGYKFVTISELMEHLDK